jgi:NADPH:quinone reductase-like Zn-dependent oxidoreductase
LEIKGIATEEEDFVARVNQITGGKGIEQLEEIAAFHGTIYEYGALAAEPTPFPLFTELAKGLTVRGYTLRELFADPKLIAKAEKCVFDHVEKGDFKPRIDRVFPFSQIVEAHRYMESNEQIGKIVVSV